MATHKRTKIAAQIPSLYLGRGDSGSAIVGFLYKDALEELIDVYSDDFVASQLGYEGRNSLDTILGDGVPSHMVGEALYVLYLDTFDKKPPMSDAQKNGLTDPEHKKRRELLRQVRKPK